jgi:hypothetical protein
LLIDRAFEGISTKATWRCGRSAKAPDFIRLAWEQPSRGAGCRVAGGCLWYGFRVAFEAAHALENPSMRFFARLLLLCLISLPVLAEPVTNLYQVRVPVASQQPDDRAQALQQAFDILVQRLTGDPKAAQSEGLGELRKDPQQLLSQYGYEQDALVASFDPAATERSLRQAGLALWSANRPSLLAWWLTESADGKNLLGDGQPGAEPLRRAAQNRGLPLRLPMADLDEQLAVGGGDAQTEALKAVSARYAADGLLLVRAGEDGGKWQARWRLSLGDQTEQGNAQADTSDALADAVMLAVSEQLAPRFVARPGTTRSLTVQVDNTDLARYAQLERLLEPFSARLQRVEGTRLTYQVNANPDQLRAQLALAHLQEVAVAAPMAPAAPDAAAVPADLLQFQF